MKAITGTHFNYFQVCKRKLWLYHHGIQMEHSSDLVKEGKSIHESSYSQRSQRFKEIEIGGIKIDFYDSKDKVINEIKKSSKEHSSHIWQVKYYIFVLEKAGLVGVSGLLEYPKERKKEEVFLSEADRLILKEQEEEIEMLCAQEGCPEKINKSKCKKCSYYDFCYSNEE